MDVSTRFDKFLSNLTLSDMQKADGTTKRGSVTAPEWCFKRARKKIQAGHCTFG